MATDKDGRLGFRGARQVGLEGGPAVRGTVAGGRADSKRSAEGDALGGYMLLDPAGQKLGRVERLFCGRYGEPQYVEIRTGFLGRRLALIPVMDVAVNHEGRDLTLR